jgi:hypothetical protein
MLSASSTLDYVSSIGTAVGALATVVAVLVALFGPSWRERRKRPRLSLTREEAEINVDAEATSPVELRIRVDNARGKDTAAGVEVFVTVTSTHRDRGGTVILVKDGSLNFERPRADYPGRSTATVPSGHSRPVSVALIGPVTAVETCFHETMRGKASATPGEKWAGLSLFGFSGGAFSWREIPWLGLGETYDVEFVVTGANFDALTFRGQLRLSDDIEPGGPRMIVLEWLGPLRAFNTHRSTAQVLRTKRTAGRRAAKAGPASRR